MSLIDLTSVHWAVLLPAALLFLIPLFWGVHLCLARPRRGLLVAVLLLPIYLTSESLLRFLASVFGGSQTVIPADILFVLVFAGFLLTRRAATLFREPARYPIALCLLFFLIAALFSLVHSDDLLLSLMALFSYAQLFVIALAVEAIPDGLQDLERVVRHWMYSYIVVLGAGLFGLVSLWAGWDTFPVHSMQAIKATFRFPNQLSFFLTASLPVFFSLTFRGAVSRRMHSLVLLSMPFALALAWFSGSRSGVASVVVAGATVCVLHATRARVYAWTGLAILVLAGSYVASTRTSSEGLRENSARYTILLDPASRSSETTFYETTDAPAISAFLDFPFFGGGVGTVLSREVQDDQPLEAHNVFIGVLGQTGLLGLLACLMTLALAVHNVVRARAMATSPFVKELAAGTLAALAGTLVHGLANFDWRARYFWFLLAMTTVVRMAAEREFQSVRALAGVRTTEDFLIDGSLVAPAPLRS